MRSRIGTPDSADNMAFGRLLVIAPRTPHETHMDTTDPLASASTTSGTKDGCAAGDHDEPYRFGRPRPTTRAPFPFNDRQFARLLILRGRIHDTAGADDCAA